LRGIEQVLGNSILAHRILIGILFFIIIIMPQFHVHPTAIESFPGALLRRRTAQRVFIVALGLVSVRGVTLWKNMN